MALIIRDECVRALPHHNVKAWLAVLGEGETSNDPSAYREVVGGSQFDGDLSQHPRIAVQTKWGWSSGFGKYQIMAAVPGKVKTDTYDWLSKSLGPSMEPEEQDIKAVGLTIHRGALQAVMEGRIDEACRLCNQEWASLPGSGYGQPTQRLSKVREVFVAYGGTLDGGASVEAAPLLPVPPASQEVKPMQIFMALLPSILQALPQLAQVFSSDATAKAHNVAAVSVVSDALIKATQSPNLQAAVESLSDPDKLKAAQAAINEVWGSITESGGGGIDGARKAAGLAPPPDPEEGSRIDGRTRLRRRPPAETRDYRPIRRRGVGDLRALPEADSPGRAVGPRARRRRPLALRGSGAPPL